MKKIAIINGPNLNSLGKRQPEVYGTTSLDQIIDKVSDLAKDRNISIVSFQSNSEGAIIDYIQSIEDSCDGVIINPGALMMAGYPLLDCIIGSSLPFVEVHISNVYTRESFRHKSVIASACIGQITGFGTFSYELGLFALEKQIAS